MSKEIFKEEKVFTRPDFENEKSRKEESEKLRKEESEKLKKEESEKLRDENDNEQLRKTNVVKDATIKKSIEIKRLEEYKNATDSYPNWFNKNKFKNILAIIDSNTLNYRHKIGEFKYIDIKTWLIKLEMLQLVKCLLKKIQIH